MNEFLRNLPYYFFFAYSFSLMASYFILAFLALLAIKEYTKTSTIINETFVKGAQDLPSITLVAPAYNEGLTIITNVYSLLSLQYPNYKLIIVNDGSKDDSLQQLINEFKLCSVPSTLKTQLIKAAPIRNVYISINTKFNNLTVIDKENGGRADAINCGIANADTDLILCTDADCIIEQGALLKMVRPYLEELDHEIIACGGAIGIANDAVIRNGTLTEVKLPKKHIARVQVVEYMRSFLIGRMAWGHINSLMLVSGAFGLYPRKRLLEVGGFDKDSIGEDLELCIRLRKHMEELKKPYKVVYIPDTLCWTEAPWSCEVFVSQRDRWSRGLMETLLKHKHLFFNRSYGRMGKIIFPYWVLFEFGAPLVEVIGLLNIVYLISAGELHWQSALLLLTCVYLIGCFYSTVAVLFHVKKYDHYAKASTVIRLLLATYSEPFTVHPIMLYAQIKGMIKKWTGVKSSWGTMTRTGF